MYTYQGTTHNNKAVCTLAYSRITDAKKHTITYDYYIAKPAKQVVSQPF
jgi:hypothetical protein